MIQLIFNLQAFDSERAAAKDLCVMVAYGYSGSQITNIETSGGVVSFNPSFKGAGTCTNNGTDTFYFTYNSVRYAFNAAGMPIDDLSGGWKLMMGEVVHSADSSELLPGMSQEDIDNLEANQRLLSIIDNAVQSKLTPSVIAGLLGTGAITTAMLGDGIVTQDKLNPNLLSTLVTVGGNQTISGQKTFNSPVNLTSVNFGSQGAIRWIVNGDTVGYLQRDSESGDIVLYGKDGLRLYCGTGKYVTTNTGYAIDGKDNSYVLLAGGGTKPLSEFGSSSSQSPSVPVGTSQITDGAVTLDKLAPGVKSYFVTVDSLEQRITGWKQFDGVKLTLAELLSGWRFDIKNNSGTVVGDAYVTDASGSSKLVLNLIKTLHTDYGDTPIATPMEINTPSLSGMGIVTAGSFIKLGGTNQQILMADGSVRELSSLPSNSGVSQITISYEGDSPTVLTPDNNGNITINAGSLSGGSQLPAPASGRYVICQDSKGTNGANGSKGDLYTDGTDLWFKSANTVSGNTTDYWKKVATGSVIEVVNDLTGMSDGDVVFNTSDNKFYKKSGSTATELSFGSASNIGLATTTNIGGIKLYEPASGTFTGTGKNYAVKLDNNGVAYVSVPWTSSSVGDIPERVWDGDTRPSSETQWDDNETTPAQDDTLWLGFSDALETYYKDESDVSEDPILVGVQINRWGQVIAKNEMQVGELANMLAKFFVTSVVWTDGSVSSSTIAPNGTTNLSKGTVRAYFADGRNAVVTNSAEFAISPGTINNFGVITADSNTTTHKLTVTCTYTYCGRTITAVTTKDGSTQAKVEVTVQQSGGEQPQETTYYWYVGHDNPMNMSSITPLSSNAASAGAGWRTIGNTLPTYSKQSPLWDSNSLIATASSKSTQYVALPSASIKSRNDITEADITGDNWTINPTKKTLNGVQYTVWTSINTKKSFGETLY